MSRRFLSLLLALAIVLTLPLPALAEEDSSPAPSPMAEAAQTPEPTAEPEPTVEPTPEPADEPEPAPEPTPEPTDEPEPTAQPEDDPAGDRGVLTIAAADMMAVSDVPQEDLQEAAAWIRSRMKAREPSVTVTFSFTDELYDRDTLSGMLNGYVDTLWNAALDYTGRPAEGDYLRWLCSSCKPELRYTTAPESSAADSKWIYECTLTLTLEYLTSADEEQALDARASQVLQDLALTGKSDYARISAIYDYICEHVTRLDSASSGADDSAYGALINGRATSRGIALLLYRLALEAGITCRVAANETGSQVWDLIRLYGAYYNADASMDAGAGDEQRQYFLRGEANFSGHSRGSGYAFPVSSDDYVSSGTEEPSQPENTPVPETAPGGVISGSELTWRIADDTLTISGEGAMPDFSTSASAPWHSRQYQFRHVVIDSGVTSIGANAFSSHATLADVRLPDTAASIGHHAFYNCGALTDIVIPGSVQTIGESAFYNCASLRSADLSPGLASIEANAFYGCSSLTSIVFPDTLRTIGFNAFQKCTGLESVTLPAGVTSVGRAVFLDCTALRSVTVQNPACALEIKAYGALGESNIATIYCHEGSTAEAYAKKYNYSFHYIGYLSAPVLTDAANAVGGVNITWESVDGAEKYRVYYKTGTGGWKTAGDTVMAETAYIWTGAKSGTKYTFTVRCIDEDGNVTSLCDSAGKSVRYIARPAFSAKNAATGISVSWGKVTGAAKYRVSSRTGSGEWTKITDTTKTSYTWTGAVSGTGYDIRVQAIASDGTISSGEDRGVSILYLAQPKISSAVNTTEGVKLTWSKVSGVQSYELLYKAGKGAWTHLADIAAEAEAVYEWKGPVIGTKYAFTVKSTAQDAASSYNTTGVSLTYLAAPAVKSVEGASSGIKISWDKVSGAAKYRVYYASSLKEDGTPDWKKLADAKSSASSYTWKKAKYGVKYYFTVGCVDSKGKKATSAKYETDEDYITLLAAPSVSLSNTAAGMKISWKAVTNADKYTVTVNGEVVKADETGTTYLYDKAVSGTKYTVTVQSLGNGERIIGKVSSTKSITYLNAPKITEIKASTSGIQISWDAVKGASRYRVYYATKLDTDETPAWKTLANTKSTGYNWKKAKPDIKYYFTVVCMDSKYKKATSDKYDTAENTFTLQKTPAVTTAMAADGIKLTIKDAPNYKLTVKLGKTVVLDTKDSKAEYLFTNVASGKKYTFTVQALDAAGKTVSKVSSSKSATYIAPPEITAEAVSNGIKVSWKKVAGASKYQVCYLDDSGSPKKIATVSSKSTSYLWKKAVSGTEYQIVVRCMDSKGKKATSVNSDPVAVTYTKA